MHFYFKLDYAPKKEKKKGKKKKKEKKKERETADETRWCKSQLAKSAHTPSGPLLKCAFGLTVQRI